MADQVVPKNLSDLIARKSVHDFINPVCRRSLIDNKQPNVALSVKFNLASVVVSDNNSWRQTPSHHLGSLCGLRFNAHRNAGGNHARNDLL
jgi:hypothetical protein